MSTFNPASLTRDYVVATALADPIFRTALTQLKVAEGFGPTAIHIKDDHRHEEFFDVEDVVVVVTFEADGSPSKPSETDTAQDGRTHLPAWIMPAQIDKVDDCWTWNIRNKNPVYVHPDGKVHITKMSTGVILYVANEDKEFDTVVRKNRGVYTLKNWRTYEAHVWLTVSELSAL